MRSLLDLPPGTQLLLAGGGAIVLLICAVAVLGPLRRWRFERAARALSCSPATGR